MHLQRLEELKEAGPRQRADLQRLQDMCSALVQDQEALKASIDRAEKLHGNLQSRCAPCLGVTSAATFRALQGPSCPGFWCCSSARTIERHACFLDFCTVLPLYNIVYSARTFHSTDGA